MKGVTWTACLLLLSSCAEPRVIENNNNQVVEQTSREVALTCFLNMSENFHIHAYLSIYINGVLQEIPSNVGISYRCVKPIHTHDATGKIHVEAPQKMDFTIGDFFAVWGKTFSATQILDSVSDAQHVIQFTVNGEPNTQFDSYVMKDLDRIVIRYESL